jgi:hypothetical protein
MAFAMKRAVGERLRSSRLRRCRWRLTSAAVVDSASDQRSGVFTCWRGNAAGLGGWTFVTRISLATLQAIGMAFFGLYGSTAALATTLTLSGACLVACEPAASPTSRRSAGRFGRRSAQAMVALQLTQRLRSEASSGTQAPEAIATAQPANTQDIGSEMSGPHAGCF